MNRAQMLQIAALAAPAAVVGFLHTALGPAPVPPDPRDGGALPVSTTTTPSTPEQARAAEWLSSLNFDALLPSPLDHPAPAVQREEPSPSPTFIEPEPEAAPGADPLAGLKLKAVLGSQNGSMAMINGRIFRVGDEVRPGCKVLSVDAHANRVEIQRPDGTTGIIGRDR
jgi:hypothetical protein